MNVSPILKFKKGILKDNSSLFLGELVDVEIPYPQQPLPVNGSPNVLRYKVKAFAVYCSSSSWNGHEDSIDKRGDGSKENPFRNTTWALRQILCELKKHCYKPFFILYITGTVDSMVTPYYIPRGPNCQYLQCYALNSFRHKLIISGEKGESGFLTIRPKFIDNLDKINITGGLSDFGVYSAGFLVPSVLYMKNIIYDNENLDDRPRLQYESRPGAYVLENCQGCKIYFGFWPGLLWEDCHYGYPPPGIKYALVGYYYEKTLSHISCWFGEGGVETGLLPFVLNCTKQSFVYSYNYVSQAVYCNSDIESSNIADGYDPQTTSLYNCNILLYPGSYEEFNPQSYSLEGVTIFGCNISILNTTEFFMRFDNILSNTINYTIDKEHVKPWMDKYHDLSFTVHKLSKGKLANSKNNKLSLNWSLPVIPNVKYRTVSVMTIGGFSMDKNITGLRDGIVDLTTHFINDYTYTGSYSFGKGTFGEYTYINSLREVTGEYKGDIVVSTIKNLESGDTSTTERELEEPLEEYLPK